MGELTYLTNRQIERLERELRIRLARLRHRKLLLESTNTQPPNDPKTQCLVHAVG